MEDTVLLLSAKKSARPQWVLRQVKTSLSQCMECLYDIYSSLVLHDLIVVWLVDSKIATAIGIEIMQLWSGGENSMITMEMK